MESNDYGSAVFGFSIMALGATLLLNKRRLHENGLRQRRKRGDPVWSLRYAEAMGSTMILAFGMIFICLGLKILCDSLPGWFSH